MMYRTVWAAGVLLQCFGGVAAGAAGGVETAAPVYVADALQERIVWVHLSWGKLGMNTAVKPAHRAARKLCVNDRTYERGLGMHADGELCIDLAGEYALFEAEVGVQWQGGTAAGSVVFQVFVDDRQEFDSGVMRENDPPRPIRVSVKDADELRLVVTSAGDGITGDVANWLNARLLRDPRSPGRRKRQSVNVAQFAQIMTCDPGRVKGTSAHRTEEFPAADLALTKELLPASDKSYAVPCDREGTGCIGLQWREFRYFREVGLSFADPGDVPDGVQLQQWVGQSSWQGAWRPLGTLVKKAGNQWTWQLDDQARQQPTDKLRWLFPAATKPITVSGVMTHTMTSWRTAELRLEADAAVSAGPVEVAVYNGELLPTGPAGESRTVRTWQTARPLRIAVRYARTRRCKTDQTVLRLRMAGQAFGVAVEDVLANEAVYVPTAGLFVTKDSSPLSLAEYAKSIAGQKTLLARVHELPDQTFLQAIKAVHIPLQDHGPTMLSLACDERKFVAYRDGPVGFTLKDRASAVFDGKTHRGRRSFPYRLVPVCGDGTREKLTRHLEGRWLPIPVTSIDQEGVVYRVRTCVAPLDESPPAGAPAWLRQRAACVVQYTIENTRPEQAEALLALSVQRQNKPDERLALKPVERGVIVTSGERLLVFIDTDAVKPLKVESDSGTAIVMGTLPPGAKAQAVAYLPAWNMPASEYASLRGKAPELTAKTRQYWQELLASGAQIDLPDQLLSDVIRASIVHIMLAAGNEENGARIDVWTSADRYGALESESQPIIRGMDMMGQQDFARRGLEFFLARYNEAGFLTTGYTMMGSGWHLWTLAEFVDRTGDLEVVKGRGSQSRPPVPMDCQAA